MAAFAGFLLKTSVGLCICWAISKTVASPDRKFLVWLGFLVSAGCYWLWLAGNFVPHAPELISLTVPTALASGAPVGKWQIQDSWELSLSVLFRSLGALYLIILSLFLFARVKKHLHLKWILQFTYRAPDAIENIFRPIAESLNAGNVQLRMLSGIHSPATFGWIRPTVLLPPFCLKHDEMELADIFRHELQHVQRRDYVFNTIASLCCALLFFHPAVWYAVRSLELESELACDLAVISNSPDRRATYAEYLVGFARLNVAQEPSPWNVDFIGSSVQLKARIRSLLAETRTIPSWMMGLRATLGLLLLAGFLGIAPSLFIGLSYERHRIEQPVKSTLLATRSEVRLRSRRTYKTQLQKKVVRISPTFEVMSPSVPATAPVEASVNATQTMPRRSDQILSREPQPTLKRRGESPAIPAPKSSSATVISLSNEPPPHPKSKLITKGRAVASILTTAAGEAARIASHDRDREGH
ncbi:MAG: M56 family metallopeptidase [Acidobacteriaceae bacterium]